MTHAVVQGQQKVRSESLVQLKTGFQRKVNVLSFPPSSFYSTQVLNELGDTFQPQGMQSTLMRFWIQMLISFSNFLRDTTPK